MTLLEMIKSLIEMSRGEAEVPSHDDIAIFVKTWSEDKTSDQIIEEINSIVATLD